MINRNLVNNRLIIEYDEGIMDGKQQIKRKSFSRLNRDVTDETLYNFAEAYNMLASKPVYAVLVAEDNELEQV